MPIDISVLSREISPSNTVLILGAGASMRSGAPSGAQLADILCRNFELDPKEYPDLVEVCSIIEMERGRDKLVAAVRAQLAKLKPTAEMLNFPQISWGEIYTTNFDRLVEDAYLIKAKSINVVRSNFDFSTPDDPTVPSLYKIHGCVSQDLADGHKTGMTLTRDDYRRHEEYREILFSRLGASAMGNNVLILGQSLADEHLRVLVDKVSNVKRKYGGPGKVFLVVYERNDRRAKLLEDANINVCFAEFDEVVRALFLKEAATRIVWVDTGDPLDAEPTLRSKVIDVKHALTLQASASAMSRGRAASYGDIARGFVFERTFAPRIEALLASNEKSVCVITGAAGVGKTTLARMATTRLLKDRGFYCWEHRDEHPFSAKDWHAIDAYLEEKDRFGVIFVDECHQFLRQVGLFADAIAEGKIKRLKLLLTSNLSLWTPRIKSPNIFKLGEEINLRSLDDSEVSLLVQFISQVSEIREYVDPKFWTLSDGERRSLLRKRCGSDMFVCIKNIFSNDEIDNVVLKEFLDLDSEDLQEIYRSVAALEAGGVRVHRQLILRMLNIASDRVADFLNRLDGLVEEFGVDERYGIYGWQTRHQLIAQVIAKYKFADPDRLFDLLNGVVLSLNPTYYVELRTARGICDREFGIGRLADKKRQNEILKNLISRVPGERVPRHRLIRNFLDLGDFSSAEHEIKEAVSTVGLDPPLNRYSVQVYLGRAGEMTGIMEEDRFAIRQRALEVARKGAARFRTDKYTYDTLCDVGFTMLPHRDGWDAIYDGLKFLYEAENTLLDPEIRNLIDRVERKTRQAEAKFGRQRPALA